MLVQRVARGSVADRMGLRGGFIPVQIGEEEILAGGDVILKVAGVPVSRGSILKLQQRIDDIPQDGTISVTYLRGGKVREVTTKKER